MPAHAHLAIDLGAESGRAMLGIVEDAKLELRELHRFENRPCHLPTGWHWDLTDLFRQIKLGMSAAGKCCENLGIPLESIGVDTWGVDFALIGRTGEVLGLPHCYRDERIHPAFDWAVKAIGPEAIYEATGIQLMAINSLFQLIATSRADPRMLESADALLFMPDLFHYLLSGEPRIEHTIASTSQLMDMRSRRWATDLLDRAGIPTQFLGDTIDPGAEVGTLLPTVAEETGLTEGLRIIAPGSHDTASAVAAVPAKPGSRWCFLSSGTWSLLGAELPAPVITDAARQAPFTNESGVAGTTRFLQNIVGLWLVQECRRSFAEQGSAPSYEQLTKEAASAAPLRTIVDATAPQFGLPGRMPDKIIDFATRTGQPIPASHGEIIRCCLESLALQYRRTLEQLESVLGETYDVMHIVGGGGRNELLNQMAADATGRRVVVGPHEATAAGNALVQAMGCGYIDDLSHVRSIVAGSFRLSTYEPQNSSAWEDAYARYDALADLQGTNDID